MPPSLLGQHPAARGALNEALLQKIGFDHIFNRIATLGQRGGKGFDPDGATAIVLRNERQVTPVRAIQTQQIHTKARERVVSNRFGDFPVAFNHRKIHHPAQKTSGDPGRAARAFCDLARAVRVRRDAQQARPARNDFIEFFNSVELQPGRDAKTVTQWRCQQAKTRGRTHERKGLQLDPHRAGRRPFANDQIKLKILHRRVEHLFDHRVHTVNFVDEKHIPCLKIGEDRREITRLGQNGPGGHFEIHPQLAGHDLRQCGFPETRRAVKKHMIHRLFAAARALDKDPQVGPGIFLPDKFVQSLWAQRAVGVFGFALRAQGWIGLIGVKIHPVLLLWRQQFQRSFDEGGHVGLWRIRGGLGHGLRRI